MCAAWKAEGEYKRLAMRWLWLPITTSLGAAMTKERSVYARTALYRIWLNILRIRLRHAQLTKREARPVLVYAILTSGSLWYGTGIVVRAMCARCAIAQRECWGDCSHFQQREETAAGA